MNRTTLYMAHLPNGMKIMAHHASTSTRRPGFRSGLLGLLLLASTVQAQTATPTATPGNAGVCAQVKVEIPQALTFERIAFDAKMVITNNQPVESLENVLVTVFILDKDGEPADELFFTNLQNLDNISGVDGTGSVGPGIRSEIHWLIIPSADAGGDNAFGIQYAVGASLTFTVNGVAQEIPVFPDTITVKPQPKLVLDYFLPRDVDGDDPFTLDTIEESVPFNLGVRIQNQGWGPANKLKISSGQPKIVENEKGLLIAFRLLSCQVGNETKQPTLNLDFGDMQPQSCLTGRWQMLVTLMGQFVEFSAEFKHAAELGGDLTSLIKEVNAHFLIHDVQVDIPGRDTILDFLADVDRDPGMLPDTVFESDCQVHPVNDLAGTTVGYPKPEDPTATLTTNYISGFVYTKVTDPAVGNQNLTRVVRSDGKEIKVPQNAWVTKKIIRQLGQPERTEWSLHVFDYNTTGSYTLEYTPPAPDTTAPVSQVIVTEPKFWNNPTYLTPATQIIFYSEDDNSGIGDMQYTLDGGAWQPAYPFWINDPGLHTITLQAIDRSGNAETPHDTLVFVDNDPPLIGSFTTNNSNFYPGNPPGGADRELLLLLAASDAVPDMNVLIEIAQGTADTNAAFAVLPGVKKIRLHKGNGVTAVSWNGRRDSDNAFVPEGDYTARVRIDDHLEHNSFAFTHFTVVEFLPHISADPTNADQQYPDLDGRYLVWQDFRSGNWDIYRRNVQSSAVTQITTNGAAQETPRVSSRYIVWQDFRNGDYDIFGYDMNTSTEFPVVVKIGDQKSPDVSGPWVVYQDNVSGDWEVFAYNIQTTETIRLTTNAQMQIRPRLEGDRIVWEDYRFGLGEIYEYDLVSRTETRLTNNIDNQTLPVVSGDRVVWVDQRHQNRDLYVYDRNTGLSERLTTTTTDESQPALSGDRLLYTDYTAGLNDSGLSLRNFNLSYAIQLTFNPSRQEEPSISGNAFAWQDNRSGKWQIYYALGLPPIAIGGPDQKVDVTSLVTLDGSGSYSADENPLSYHWTLLERPAGSTATLSDVNAAMPTFTADKPGDYVAQLVVDDGILASAPDIVKVLAVRLGDVNNDNVLDMDDVAICLQISVGIAPAAVINLNADVNNDGRIGLEEANYVLRQLGY